VNKGFDIAHAREVMGKAHPRQDQINAVGEHAGDPWTVQAADFIMAQTGEFSGEDVVALARGVVPDPPDDRAWGFVFLSLGRVGRIVKTGHYKSRANGNPMPVWRVAGRSER